MKTKFSIVSIVTTSALGNVFLGKGMKQLGDISHLPVDRMVLAAFGSLLNPWVAAGVVFLLAFFISYMTILSWADPSYVLPATAPSYLVTAALSYWILGERISPARWLGVVMIVAGVALVSRTAVRTTK